MVRCIKEFVEATSRKVLHFIEAFPENGSGIRDLRTMFSFSTITQSHQAFSSALSSQLDDILLIVVELDKYVIKQDKSMTLSRLMLTLEPQFELRWILYYFLVEAVIRPLSSSSSQQNVAFLAKRFLDGITKRTFSKIPRCFVDQSQSPSRTLSPSSSSLSPSKLTSHLLNTIYGCLMLTDQTAAFNDREVGLILQVWMETCRPYLEMLDDWMKFGSFHDPCNEFFIRRNENWGNLGEQFWDVSVCIEQSEDSSFLFLNHVLKEIIVAGKSLKLLDTIAGRKMNVGGRKQQDATSLYQLYSESLVNALHRDDHHSLAGNNSEYDDDDDHNDERSERHETDESENEDVNKDSLIDKFLGTLYSSPAVDEVFFKTLRKKLKETDPLLLLSALNSIKSHRDTHVEESKHNSKSSSSSTIAPETSNICSNFFFHLSLHKSLESFVQLRYSEASFELLNVIRNDCHLHQHLNSIKKYFLMESGRMMFDFYSALFRAMDSGVEWSKDGYLKFMLCESFRDERPEELDRITIVVKDSKEPSTNICCLESIVMDYKAPWPCDVVINSKSMACYCQIFQFLLQLKWAKYSLDCLRFSDLQISEANKSLKHRMFIFKMSVLHFVNSFHNYIMTRILHSVGLEFQMKFDSARDFDELLFIHSCYLETLQDRCLLHGKVYFIKNCILKVLQMSLDISRMWKASVICEGSLKNMEIEYNKCIQFLSSMASQVIARGSKAHLELLAFTFHSCQNSDELFR